MEDMNADDTEKPLKDYGSFSHNPVCQAEIEGHHTDRWQHQAMYVGLHFPQTKKRRHHHKKDRHHRRRHDDKDKAASTPTQESIPERPATPPGERVKFLLGNKDETDNEHEAHEIFCEMDELRAVGDDGDFEWKETARWIKFEEDVEEGGDRWSKPFVATLSLHSLFELRKGIVTGTVMLDADATNLLEITELVVDNMVAQGQMPAEHKERVQDVLLTRHHHQHNKKHHGESKGLPFVRSLADIGKKYSEKKLDDNIKKSASGLHLMPSSKSLGDRKDTTDGSMKESPSQFKFNEHYAKKIPAGAEASNILVGEVDFLEQPIIAFARLSRSVLLGELTEVPVPTRFLFVLLGPQGNQQRYHEIGRSIATLMSDEVFHEVAYKARHREDLLAGIDEFLDQVTVLPPGEWDPTIRIQPPKSVPSQEGRKKAPTDPSKSPGAGLPNGLVTAEPEEESHGDPTLERTGRVFGGLIQDVKRKLPWYLSDFRDGVALQCLASFGFIYFACLTPIITFGGLLGAATDNHLAAMESLVSGAICGISYHLFSGQPLTIIGSTGPVLVFETIVYNFCKDYTLDYLAMRFWIGIWMALALFIMVVFDLSALVRYITRFTEESFAMLIALIFIVEAFKKLFHILDHHGIDTTPHIEKFCFCVPHNASANDTMPQVGPHIVMPTFLLESRNETLVDYQSISDKEVCTNLGGKLTGAGCNLDPNVFLFSCVLFLGTFILSMGLKFFRNTRFFPNIARSLVSDFAVFAAILIMVGVDAALGLDTPKLLVPEQFRPTRPDRGWIINPFANSWYWIPAAILPALLATILIFMDQQITAVIVNRKEHKLLKGGGYHLDLLLIVIQIVICSLVGTPWFVAATVLSINHVRSLTRESETSAPGERPKFLGIREQRLTGTLVFVLVGLSALMANVLKYIPMPVLYGVFLFMGVSSLKGIQLMQRFMIIFMPAKYQPDYIFLRHVPVRRVHLFTLIQILCLAALWVIKTIKMVSIIFPLMVLAMCFVRKALDWVFTRHELKWLDDIMPESHKREKEEKKKKLMEEQEEQIIEMSGGQVHIPLKEGKSIQIPVDRIHYDPINKKLKVADESMQVSKTAIWKQLNSESDPKMDYQLRSRKPMQDEANLTKASDSPKEHGPVRFNIGDETPAIVVDPPSIAGSHEDTRC